MFLTNFLILFISLLIILGFFLFFHLSSQLYTFLFSILDFILNNSQLLLILTNTDDYDLIQNINAENDIENRYNDSSNPTISINRNLVDNDNVVVGAWTPIIVLFFKI